MKLLRRFSDSDFYKASANYDQNFAIKLLESAILCL